MPSHLRDLVRSLLMASVLAASATAALAIDHGAVGIVKWSLPAVRCDRVYQAVLSTDGSYNDIVFWPRLPDWKNQLLTPDPSAIYVLPFLNMRAVGPLVLEIPQMADGTITGTLFDCGLRTLDDARPSTANIDASGKYLVLPPDYDGTAPEGYVTIRSRTFQDYAVLRLNPRTVDEGDVTSLIRFARQIQLYPLSRAADPPATTFVDASHVEFDATVPFDLRYFQSLDRIVQTEPSLAEGTPMIDKLKSIGIEKGRIFLPDPDARTTLETAARDAQAQLATRSEVLLTNYYRTGHWAVWERDAGRFGLLTSGDEHGQPFDGGHLYRLRVPASVPVTQYWSATVYDRSTHTFIRNMPWPGRWSESPGLQKNADGSVDIYFGPSPPDGRGSNWIPTTPYGDFEVVFRFHGPGQLLFDKTWQLPDIEHVE